MSTSSPDQAGGADSRVRFLRACDRCRTRKIKCGNENPCAKCVAAKVTCSFSSMAGSTSRPLLSTRESSATASTSYTSYEQGHKRSRVEDDEHAPPKRQVLDSDNTAHFYTSSHGLSHHAGSTSGLPLLEATRRRAADTGAAPQADRAEPDWQWLQNMLADGTQSAPTGGSFHNGSDDSEYFPGRSLPPRQSDDHLLTSVSEASKFPVDLMSELLRVFFETIHPVWPLLHIPSFFDELYRWENHSFVALVVSMCMLASRYVDDPRVMQEKGNRATAGLSWQPLFSRLLEHAIYGDQVIYAIQSRFFGSMFHSVDNIPHPVAQGYLAEAVTRTLDGGLHRSVSSSVLGSAVLREIRCRTAWAVYVYDQQLGSVCGRPALSSLWHYDVRLPEPFSPNEQQTDDAVAVATFRELIQVSAVLEMAFFASVQRPIIPNSDFLNDIAAQLRSNLDDSDKLDRVIDALSKWRRAAPPVISERQSKARAAKPNYSVATEQVASVDQMVQLLVIARYLQLETLSSTPRRDQCESYRASLLTRARDITAVVVQLGAVNLLSKCDIMVAYRLLFTGRLLLACILSARSDDNAGQVEEATKILHAASVVLRHFVSVFPVALGAAEVLDETIRVCRVPPPHSGPRHQSSAANRYAWYRPLVHHGSKSATTALEESGTSRMDPPLDPSTGGTLTGPAEPTDLSPFDLAFSVGNVPMPMYNADLSQDPSGDPDFSWLLPGGEANLPYYFPPSV